MKAELCQLLRPLGLKFCCFKESDWYSKPTTVHGVKGTQAAASSSSKGFLLLDIGGKIPSPPV